VNNLAGESKYKRTVDDLHRRLTGYLAQTADPRFTDQPVRFDEYAYRAGYMKKHLEEHGYR
jgi:N-sulfoglucosamine sulfohydrolase